MLLDELPDLVLREICVKLDFKDIGSLRETNRRFLKHIKDNRIHYSKKKVESLTIHIHSWHKSNVAQKRKVSVKWQKKDGKLAKIILPEESEKEMINWFNPNTLISHDNDELVNMHPSWWRDIKILYLYKLGDIGRYLPYLDRFTEITLNNDNLMNLSEILASMETKNLKELSVEGSGELNCTDEDLRKIGRLSKNMRILKFENMSKSSNISNDAILDMIEAGSFADDSYLTFSRLPHDTDMLTNIARRHWTVEHNAMDKTWKIEKAGSVISICLKEKEPEPPFVYRFKHDEEEMKALWLELLPRF